MRSILSVFAVLVVAAVSGAEVPDVAGLIQTAELNPAKPYFIPVNPKVSTTIRFPKSIGNPEGRAFIDENAKADPGEKLTGEYVVSWQQQDPYFTVTPIDETATMANLNVPYEGATYVFYFYPVATELKAIACLNLVDHRAGAQKTGEASAAPATSSTQPSEVIRQLDPPAPMYVKPTAARLIGFLDRLKLVHSMRPGGALASLVRAMNIEVAIAHEELAAGDKDVQGQPIMDGVAGEIPSGTNDAGLYQILLLRAVRDNRMNCIGFICLVRNTSDQVLAFDVKSFGA
ncbi:MAG TPA: hypothetical protein VFT61_06540, partial [Sphingomicrobium sp.]|nr:hypothetical protein [Sphingomicrobium sp.]